MPRFQLDPNKSAMENVFECASMATSVLLKSHSFYHLWGEPRDELFDEVRDAAVAHFITHKVKMHKYCRQTKDGRPLNFADNMLSSAYSVCGNIANSYLKRLSRINATEDIEPLAFALSPQQALPLYLSYEETFHRQKNHPKFSEMKRGFDRARIVRDLYEDYLAEHKELGLTSEPLKFGPWLARNGYSSDGDLMMSLEPKEVRRSWSDWKQNRRKAEQKKAERERASQDFEKVLGPPPKGWVYCKYGDVIGIRRIKEET